MRTIKFRGKRAKGECVGEWAYGELTQHDNIIWLEECEYFSGAYVQPDTIGQFTGLYDKNGKEIYEGDIIEGQGYRHVIRYEEKEVAFMAVLLPEYSWVRNDFHISQEWVTEFGKQVIGNIHDNPELL